MKRKREKIEKPKFLKNAVCLEQKTTLWKKFKHSSGKKWKYFGKNRKNEKKTLLNPWFSDILNLSSFLRLWPLTAPDYYSS